MQNAEINKYRYVDFAARMQRGFRNNITRVDQIPALIDRYRAFECYATCFLFSDEILAYRDQNNGSVAGFSGSVWAYYLPVDIDSEKGEKALKAAKAFLRTAGDLGFDEETALVYFSGSKGYHIMLDTRVFGDLQPEENLNGIFAELRKMLAKRAGKYAQECVDLQIKDRLRLLRLPNTINAKSGLYKIQLYLDEIYKLEDEEIRELAKKPRKLRHTDRSGLIPAGGNIGPSRKAQELFQEARENAQRKAANSGIAQVQRKMIEPANLQGGGDEHATIDSAADLLCEARRKMLIDGVAVGERNNACVRLTSALRAKGMPAGKVRRIMAEWAQLVGLPQSEIEATIRSVYSRIQPYDYGCTDELIEKYCPYRRDRIACRHYRIYRTLKALA